MIQRWLIQEFGPIVSAAYVMVGFVSLLITLFFTVSLRNRGGGEVQGLYMIIYSTIAAAAVVVLSFMIVFIPSFIGKEFATRDLDDPGHFLTATFVIKGKRGIEGERAISLDGSDETIEGRTCEEFVGGSSNSPSTLCEITHVQIILRNSGAYFVRDLQTTDGMIYRIAEDNVIRVAFQRYASPPLPHVR